MYVWISICGNESVVTSTIQYHSSKHGVGYLILHHTFVGVPNLSLQLSEKITGQNFSSLFIIQMPFTKTPYGHRSDIFRVIWYLLSSTSRNALIQGLSCGQLLSIDSYVHDQWKGGYVFIINNYLVYFPVVHSYVFFSNMREHFDWVYFDMGANV